MERKPPQDIELERVILGSCMVNDGVLLQAVESLEDNDFYARQHKTIYRAICTLYEREKVCDIILLAGELGENMRHTGGEQYLAELLSHVATVTNIEPHVERLKKMAYARTVILKAIELQEKAYNTDDFDELPAMLSNIADTHQPVGDAGVQIRDCLQDYYLAKKDMMDGKKKRGISTGLSVYDAATGGFHGGEMIVVAALQKMGKSNFAMSLASHHDVQGGHTAIFSLEMGREEIIDRLVSQRTAGDRELPQRAVRLGELTHKPYLQRFGEVMKDMRESNCYVNTDALLTVDKIKTICRKRKRDGLLTLVVIDYLQLLVRDRHKEREEITGITRELKLLAKELDVPVILLSQINNRDAKVGERPHKGQLKGSSSIESDADVIMFPWRPAAISNDPNADKEEATLIIGAIRGVDACDIEMKFSTITTNFRELKPSERMVPPKVQGEEVW